MEKSSYVATRFDVGHDGFYVEVTPIMFNGEDMWEFYLCKEDYGLKNFMFGMLKKDAPESEWESLILGELDMYIKEFQHDMEGYDSME